MPGPRSTDDALDWAQQAVKAGRYIPSAHFVQRLGERNIDMFDAQNAILAATAIAPYTAASPQNGGTNWRIEGPDLDGTRRIAVGVETFLDKKRRRMMLITVFEA